MSDCEKTMYEKAAYTLAFFILLTFTYLFLIGTLNLRGFYLTPFLQSFPSNPIWVSPFQSLTPLRVYMMIFLGDLILICFEERILIKRL